LAVIRQNCFRQVEGADGLGLIQLGGALFQHGHQDLGFLVACRGRTFVAVQCLFNRGQIGQGEFGVNDFDVVQRAHFARHVDNVVVGKTAHHMDHRIGLADVGEELVAQSFALAGPCDETGDVHEFDNGVLDLLRFDDLGQGFQPRIRHFDDAHIGLDGAERIVLRRDTRFGQGIEESGLAHIGQADDAAFETHGASFLGAAGLVLILRVAASMSPLAMSGQASSARSMAASISSCSSRRAGFST